MFSIHWEPPLFEERNGRITGYIVRINSESHENVKTEVTQHTSLTADGLTPHTVYSISIAAQTVVGDGPYSAVVSFQTPEDG